jgi:hypothetical protein
MNLEFNLSARCVLYHSLPFISYDGHLDLLSSNTFPT